MCGIVGIVGKKNACNILVNGLEKLEYRGYDSAGIFIANSTTQDKYLIKSSGKIANLKEKLTEEIQGDIGIGHTRWATHGRPSKANAHPHTSTDGRLVLVHNGVIENFEELRRLYLAETVREGDTDTEIVVKLIEEMKNRKKMSTEEAFHYVLSLVKGSYAFALIDHEIPEVLYVAKNKSPLLIAQGTNFYGVCSDAIALLAETDTFIEIEDKELVTITSTTITIQTQEGKKVQRNPFKAQINLEEINKGTYPFYMAKEIEEQPAVIRRLIGKYSEEENLTVSKVILHDLKECDRIYIIGCGTSWHAGWIGKHLLESCSHLPTEVHLASEFAYAPPLLSKHPFFIFLSQSGETADSRQVLVQVKKLGYPTLTITNGEGSTLSRESDHTMLIHAGPEIAVASTKAYTAQIVALAFLAKALGEERKITLSKHFDLIHELGLVANAMDSVINQKEWLASMSEFLLRDQKSAFYIGRGTDYYVSMEAALKLKEISYIQAEGFAAGELKHGTIALIEEGTPVFGLISNPVVASHTRGNLKEVESRGAQTFIISMESTAESRDQLILPDVHPLLVSLLTVLPTQFIAYFASLQRGYNVDQPRNLAKSVTVE